MAIARRPAEQRLRDGARVFTILAVTEHDQDAQYPTCFAREEVPAWLSGSAASSAIYAQLADLRAWGVSIVDACRRTAPGTFVLIGPEQVGSI